MWVSESEHILSEYIDVGCSIQSQKHSATNIFSPFMLKHIKNRNALSPVSLHMFGWFIGCFHGSGDERSMGRCGQNYLSELDNFVNQLIYT